MFHLAVSRGGMPTQEFEAETKVELCLLAHCLAHIQLLFFYTPVLPA